MKKLFLIIFVLLTTTGYPQQTLPCTQIGVNNLAGPNPYITGSCLEVSSDLHVNNKNVIMEADNRIHFGAGAHISPNQQGYFHASIRPNALQVAWMEPGTVGSVGQYEKLEIGVKIPDEIQMQIFQFLNSGASAVDINHPGLNPFNPEEVSVEAIFSTTIGNTAFQLPFQRKIFGFWYREFDRSEFSEVYTELSTDYHFRIRFAPPTTGNWRCVIKMYVHGVLTNETSPFQFTVVNSGNPGYVRVGDSKRFLTLGNDMFFPIGMNLPQASCHGSDDCDLSYLDPTAHQDVTDRNGFAEAFNRLDEISPRIYDFFKEDINALKLSGGNTFRYLLTPWGDDIEYESINNYDNHIFYNYNTGTYERSYFHSHFEWELDEIFEKAEAESVFMLFNVQWHSVFCNCSNGNCGFSYYDWVPFNSDPYINDPGYCYNAQLALGEVQNFLTDPDAKKYFKYKLRYIVSRWGYSTAILAMQLTSEINGAFEAKMEEAGVIHAQIESWHSEMLSYLKNDLQVPQLSSVSYAGEPGRPIAEKPYTTAYDKSFYLQDLDLPTYNAYQDLPTRSAGIFDIRERWFPSNIDEYFQNYFNVNQTNQYNKLQYEVYENYMMKPLLNSEIGSMGPDDYSLVCDNKVEWIKNTYVTPFTGMAGMSLHWQSNYDYALWQTYFPKIATFLAPYNFNESSGNVKGWMPGYDYDEKHYESGDPKPGIVDLFYLRSPDEKRAVGVLANRTYNWYTQWNVAKCGAYVWEDLSFKDQFEMTNNTESYDDYMYNYEKNAYYINESLQADVKSGYCYRITYIHPFTLQTISTEKKLNATGKLNLDFPYITGSSSRPIILVKIEKESCFKSQEVTSDSIMKAESVEEYLRLLAQSTASDTLLKAKVFPNPASEEVTIVLPIAVDQCKVELMDSRGITTLAEIFFGQTHSVIVNGFSDGIYFLRIVYNDHIELTKIFIQ